MDSKLKRIKELIEQKEKIDSELESLINGTASGASKQRTCTICRQPGHNAKSCPTKEEEGVAA